MKKAILVLLSLFLLCGCAVFERPTEKKEEIVEQREEPIERKDPVLVEMSRMTLREKVGQLFIIRPESLKTGRNVTSINDAFIKAYMKYPAGGFCLFSQNISNPSQLLEYTEDLHNLGRFRPLLTIDEEGGYITRIADDDDFNVPLFPTNETIARRGNVNEAYRLGASIGDYLKYYGFDLDFAPVADVNTNPNNPIIGARAFGSNPNQAAEMVVAVVEGLHDSGVGGCLKHFPGHGDTSTDTHAGYAESRKTWQQLLNCEMITFKAGIEAGTDMIMVAHIAVPNITGSSTPSTLSHLVITEKLREELGYTGIIITDGMEMGAIANTYGSAEAAVMAIEAGNDIVLLPSDYYKAFEGVLDAVRSGRISEERLEASVYRILSLKMKDLLEQEKQYPGIRLIRDANVSIFDFY